MKRFHLLSALGGAAGAVAFLAIVGAADGDYLVARHLERVQVLTSELSGIDTFMQAKAGAGAANVARFSCEPSASAGVQWLCAFDVATTESPDDAMELHESGQGVIVRRVMASETLTGKDLRR